MLKHLQPLPISEEMLGAYIEGNLSMEEMNLVESILNQDVSDEDFLTEDEIADAIMKFDCETEDNISLFSQIIDNAVIPKNETVKSETVAENTTPSILDGLLGSSLYSV